MAAIGVPYEPGDTVRPTAGSNLPEGDYVVDAVLVSKDVRLVLLRGMHIGWNGGLPIGNFEKV